MSASTSLNTSIPARSLGYSVTENIYKTFAYNTPLIANDAGVAVGTIPSGARVTRMVVFIDTAFNATTTNELQIGTSSSVAAFMPANVLDMAVTGAQEYSDLIVVNTFSSDTTVYLQYDQTGTAATTGAGAVLIEFIMPHS